jgi:hypothetical protein
MFAMKPSTMRARAVTLAARRTDNFWDLGNLVNKELALMALIKKAALSK